MGGKTKTSLIHYIPKLNLHLNQNFFSQDFFFEMMMKLSGVFLVIAVLAFEKPATAQFPNFCTQEPEVGRCMMAIPRFYYDPYTNSCQSFIYGGCGGNANNFKSKRECKMTCKRI